MIVRFQLNSLTQSVLACTPSIETVDKKITAIIHVFFSEAINTRISKGFGGVGVIREQNFIRADNRFMFTNCSSTNH